MSRPSVVMMCGLPASGKTTTAGQLHSYAGGVLIRSCDVYRDLGIQLPEWIVRTRGFTIDVHEYDQVRDRAYEEIARRLEHHSRSAGLVILDAVYGERAKRSVIYAICRARRAEVTLIHCRCDAPTETARRFDRRRGRENVPEHEASDWSVFRDIERRWEDPHADISVGGGPPPIITVDTLREPRIISLSEPSWLADRLREALSEVQARAGREWWRL
jgi:predicted kinase